MNIGEITSAITAVKLTMDMLMAGVHATTDSALAEQARELNDAIIDLQMKTLHLQGLYSAVVQEKDELEKKAMDKEEWERTKKRYTLHSLSPGVFAYRLKEEVADTDPPHYICPCCYEKNLRSILQRTEVGCDGTHYGCPSCKADFIDHENRAKVSVVSVPRRDPFPGY